MRQKKTARNNGKIASTGAKGSQEALRVSEARYHSLFSNMLDGFAHCEMLFDNGRPVDFLYCEVNEAFERLTGLTNVAGKKVSEVIPGIQLSHPELFEIYGRVALTGTSEKFETNFKPLGKWLSISVYGAEKNHFIALFDDITGRKQSERGVERVGGTLQDRD